MNEALEHLVTLFTPEHYRLTIKPDPETLVFTGEVEIHGHQIKPSQVIKLHSLGLKIEDARFSIGGGEHTFVNHTHGDHDVLYLASPVEISGELDIRLKFRGEITETMVGLYPCRSGDDVILATQFESHHARAVFPCIDEPSAKATFDLTLVTPRGLSVLANTPAATTADTDHELVATTFETTPVMSTYLLAFVIGRLESRQATTRSNTTISVWSVPSQIEHTAFALDVARRAIEFYEDYFGLPYPLAKCDHVALPDFATGAMENWGLITYRESGLLVDPRHTALASKQYTALVIAHEVAHQWFGNLVTMRWWDDLWLNEGFATWMEYHAVDSLFPEWQIWDQYVTDETLPAQSMDSLSTTHPIEAAVADPEEIGTIFDSISYNKGSAVIRMLEDYLGAKAFQSGLHHYLKQYEYTNATTAELWQALEQSSGRPVTEFMQAWTKQSGFPLLNVKLNATEALELSQQRYLINPQARLRLEPTVWPIHITATGSEETYDLTGQHGVWKLAADPPVKLNTGQAGFYHVAYSSNHLTQLAAAVSAGRFEALDRMGILHDTWQLAKAGHVLTADALKLLDAYDYEDSLLVWEVIIGQLVALRSVFESEELRQDMQPYVGELVEDQLLRLAWDEKPNEPHFDTMLRPLILSQASFAGIESVVTHATELFDKCHDLSSIPPNLRGVVLVTAAREGSVETFDKMLDLYTKAPSAQVKEQLAAGLCAFRQPELVDRCLALINSEHVRRQDVLTWLSSLFVNRHAKAAAWWWLTGHWSWLTNLFGTDTTSLSYVPRIAGRSFSTREMLDEYQRFFASGPPGLKQPIAQGQESIEWRMSWRERDETAVEDFFRNWKPKSKTPKS